MTEIKPTSKSGIPLIRKLALEAFPATYAKILTPEQTEYMLEMMYSEKSLEKQFDDGHEFFAGYDDGEPFGYVSVRPESEGVFHLEKIYVLENLHGRGFGKLLFEKAKSRVKELHPAPCRMLLNVNRHNRALGFYKHMGMFEVSRGDFPIGNGYFMNDYIMGIDL